MKEKTKKEKQGLARLFELAGARKNKLTLACLLSVLSSAARIVPFFTIYGVVVELLAHYTAPAEADQGKILALCAITFGAALVYGVCAYASSAISHTAAYEIIYELRLQLMEKLSRISSGYFTGTTQGAIKKIVSDDSDQMEAFLAHHLCEIAAAIATPVFTLLYLFFMDWRMALAILSPFVLAILVLVGSKRLQNHMDLKKIQSKLDAADGIQEFLESIRDLKANNQEDTYLAGLDKKLEKIVHTSVCYEMTSGLMITSSQMLLRLGFPATVLVGTLLLTQGELNLFFFLMFLVAASRIYDPLSGVMMQLSEIFNAMLQLRRMKAIEQEPAQEGTVEYQAKGHDICFDHVGFRYQDGEDVLSDVTFTAKQGEVTALVGPSGGGKSTTAKLAARFWDIQKGRIAMGGVDISTVDPEALLTDYSMVFQDVVLFDDTVMENIRLGKRGATDEEVRAAAEAANCGEFIRRLPQGYDTPIGENGAKLSGGERQRISIARALLKNAPIVLLDEATASLDVENETKVQGALSRLLAGKTVLVIAHRMRTVAGADHIVVLENGHVAEQGTPAELMERGGLYRRMVELQSESARWKLNGTEA